jgi:lysosomal alpha-mannosidase
MYEKFGTEYQILHHKLKNSYIYPDGFGFDMFNDDDPFQTNSDLTTYNAPAEAQKLDEWLQDYSQYYATDHLFILFGMDFQYMNAFQNYENMDKMIAYMNKHYSDKYDFQYSTPSDYV